MKKCSQCQIFLPATVDNFQPNGKKGLRSNCRSCERIRSKERRKKNPQVYRDKDKRNYQSLRLKVLRHYSQIIPQCYCCGESLLEFLAIDHINGGGKQHRKSISPSHELGGRGFYQWLVNNNFPSGYRVLCHNCNNAYGCYGYCPHKTQ